MKKNVIPLVVGLIIFIIGFFIGMQYKSYQIRKSLNQAFDSIGSSQSNTEETIMKQAKKDNLQIIEKKIGDEVTLATLNIKINSIEEKQILNAKYGSPKVAKEGTKFVVVNLDVTNTTNSQFDFSTDSIIVDNKDREFSIYSDSIGAVDDYLNYRELSPSVKETGSLIYELPNDATNYSFMIAKAGTKELYKIVLK
ncbi:MAG: DUF4352 domain-containing protein [Candidatus Shapirobacteria bacterium]|jgi:hypothetical protein